jgi:hypothetical protein
MAQQKKETYRNAGFSIRGDDEVCWYTVIYVMFSQNLIESLREDAIELLVLLVKVHYILHSHLQAALDAWQTFKLGFCVGIGSRNRRALLKLLVAPRTLEILVSISDVL